MVRFTQTRDAFYIVTLAAPNSTLTLQSPVPYLPGDQVTVVGGNMSGTIVPSKLLSDGSLQLSIADKVAKADEYAWVFKIALSAGSSSTGGSCGSSGSSSASAGATSTSTATGSRGQPSSTKSPSSGAGLGASDSARWAAGAVLTISTMWLLSLVVI